MFILRINKVQNEIYNAAIFFWLWFQHYKRVRNLSQVCNFTVPVLFIRIDLISKYLVMIVFINMQAICRKYVHV